MQFKEASLNTYYLYKEALIQGDVLHKQGQLDQLDKLISDILKQEKEGYKYVQMFRLMKENGGDGGMGLNLEMLQDRTRRLNTDYKLGGNQPQI